MRSQTRTALWAVAAMLALLGRVSGGAGQEKHPSQAPARGVAMDGPTQVRVGVTTVAAQAAQYRAEVRGLGQVMGIDTIAQTDADLTTAEAAVHASQAALARARGLHAADNSVSQQTLEAAVHQAAADAAQLALAERKASGTWGRDAPWHDRQRRNAWTAKIVAGQAAILRVTFPPDSVGDALLDSIRIGRLNDGSDGRSWRPTFVWNAPADPAVPGRSYFMLVENAQGLSPGERVLVRATFGSTKAGAVVPAAAVIIAEGRTWFYVASKADYFIRQAIELSQPLGDGYFMSAGIKPGAPVVIHGAGQLLAREIGSED